MNSKNATSNLPGISVYFYSGRIGVQDMAALVGAVPDWSTQCGDKIWKSSAKTSKYNAVRFNVGKVEDISENLDQLLSEALRIVCLLSPAHTSNSSLGIQIRADCFHTGDSISLNSDFLSSLSTVGASFDVLF
jgi:hypothetical protein